MTVISLLTDFGLRDGNPGVMKGVILGIAPEVQIVDLSHDVAPQNIFEAAFVLERTAYFFPDDTVHIVVVDPGVGTARRPIAAKLGTQQFVGPDNGVITPMLNRAKQKKMDVHIVHLTKNEYWLPDVSNIFHGRDIFAPCGAYLAKGVPLDELGKPINDPVQIETPQPIQTDNGFVGEVIHIDHFGNIYTNVRGEVLPDPANTRINLNDVELEGLKRTFGESPSGTLIALLSSTNYLLISTVNGSAAADLQTRIGDEVIVLI